MPAEKTPPYLQMKLPGDETRLCLPVIEQDDSARAILKKIGLRRFVSISRDGVIFDANDQMITAWQEERRTPYTVALDNINQAEQAGTLERGSYLIAFDLMLRDAFDDSPWAQQFMPRQTDE